MKIIVFPRNKTSQGFGPAKYLLVVVYLLLAAILFVPVVGNFAWVFAFFVFFRERDSRFLRLHCAETGFLGMFYAIAAAVLQVVGDFLLQEASRVQNTSAMVNAMVWNDRLQNVVTGLRVVLLAYLVIQFVLGFSYRYLRFRFPGNWAERLEERTGKP